MVSKKNGQQRENHNSLTNTIVKTNLNLYIDRVFPLHKKNRINLNPIKRPISAVADNFEVRNAKSIKIMINKKVKFNLLYDSNRSLHKKIKIEQLRNETN